MGFHFFAYLMVIIPENGDTTLCFDQVVMWLSHQKPGCCSGPGTGFEM